MPEVVNFYVLAGYTTARSAWPPPAKVEGMGDLIGKTPGYVVQFLKHISGLALEIGRKSDAHGNQPSLVAELSGHTLEPRGSHPSSRIG